MCKDDPGGEQTRIYAAQLILGSRHEGSKPNHLGAPLVTSVLLSLPSSVPLSLPTLVPPSHCTSLVLLSFRSSILLSPVSLNLLFCPFLDSSILYLSFLLSLPPPIPPNIPTCIFSNAPLNLGLSLAVLLSQDQRLRPFSIPLLLPSLPSSFPTSVRPTLLLHLNLSCHNLI